MTEKEKKITLFPWWLKRMITNIIFLFELTTESFISDLTTFNKWRGMRDELNCEFKEEKCYK